MFNRIQYILTALLLIFSISIFASNLENLTQDNNGFALDLYQTLCQEETNLFFSPYSISSALAMTYAGARGNTQKEMSKALHFNLNSEDFHPAFKQLQDHFQQIQQAGNIELNIANALWLQEDYEIKQEFKDLNQKFYNARLSQLNFKAEPEISRQIINHWVQKQTNDKIKNILAPRTITDLTRLILANAIYFKGVWQHPFDKDNTHDMDFWLNSKDKIKAPTMEQTDYFAYYEEDQLQILEAPYKGNELSMIILLPHDYNGIASLEKNFTSENLNQWTSNLKHTEVNVLLPKFKITDDFKLKNTLIKLGMIDAFTDNADFTGIVPQRQLYISNVIHKAFVDVDETGTEAAAATIVIMRESAAPTPIEIPEFRADHPFIFLIKDKATGSILFMGKIMNPLK